MHTRTKILLEAGRLFSQRGYFAVSMDEIAQHVGVKKATLYHHFESKDALCRELVTTACEELQEEMREVLQEESNPIDSIFRLVLTMLDFALRRPEILLLNSLELGNDEKLPLVQHIVDVRNEMLRFLRGVLIRLDLTQKRTRKYTQMVATILLGLVLTPMVTQKHDVKQTATRIVSLLFPRGGIKKEYS